MKIKDHAFLLGYDPEAFVWDSKDRVALPPSYLWPLGTKSNPVKITALTKVQRDGAAIEFNTTPTSPATALSGSAILERAISDVQNFINGRYKAEGKGRYKLLFQPVVDFDQEIWSLVRPEDKVLGCDPDFNAWEKTLNNPPKPVKETTRTGAGHIHIGWGKNIQYKSSNYMELCYLVARELDSTVGITSVLIDPNAERRAMYGRAGAFRPKPYGLEYRVPSNVWVASEAHRIPIIKAIKRALSNCMSHRLTHTPDVERIINESDTKAAVRWLEHNKFNWRKEVVQPS